MVVFIGNSKDKYIYMFIYSRISKNFFILIKNNLKRERASALLQLNTFHSLEAFHSFNTVPQHTVVKMIPFSLSTPVCNLHSLVIWSEGDHTMKGDRPQIKWQKDRKYAMKCAVKWMRSPTRSN